MVDDKTSDLEKQLRDTEEELAKLNEQLELSEKERDNLQRVLDSSSDDPRVAFVRYLVAKTPINRKREWEKEFKFEQWQREITEPLKKESGALRGALFSREMNRIIDSNPAFKRVPFVYYDFFNKHSLYTPAVLEIFGINADDERAKTGKLTLMEFVGYIKREERAELVRALKEGRGLENYQVVTLGNNSRELILNAYPLVYDRNPVGVGVFFYDPNGQYPKFTSIRFAVKIRKSIEDISEEFRVIKNNVHNE